MSIPILHAQADAKKLVSNGDNVVTLSDFVVANVANRLLTVGIEVSSVATGTPAVLSAAFGGQALSYVAAIDSGDARVEVWKLIAPNVTTADVTVTITDPPGGTTRATVITVALFRTANQTEPFVISRAITKQGPSGDATLAIVSMNEELVCVWVAAQKDHPLTPVADQVEIGDLTQAGDTGPETIRGRSAYKVGEASTLVGYTNGSSGEREFALIAMPLCASDVALEARGTTEMSGTASMSRDVPFAVILLGKATILADLGASNWLQAFLSGSATTQASLQRAKLLAAQMEGHATLSARVGSGPRIFVKPDPLTKIITKTFEVDLAQHGTAPITITFQELEHAVWLEATIKINGAIRDLTGALAFLYITDNPNSPFPMGIEDGPNAKALYIAGRGDFAIGENEAQIDVLFPSSDQYRSPSFTIDVQQVVA